MEEPIPIVKTAVYSDFLSSFSSHCCSFVGANQYVENKIRKITTGCALWLKNI